MECILYKQELYYIVRSLIIKIQPNYWEPPPFYEVSYFFYKTGYYDFICTFQGHHKEKNKKIIKRYDNKNYDE